MAVAMRRPPRRAVYRGNRWRDPRTGVALPNQTAAHADWLATRPPGQELAPPSEHSVVTLGVHARAQRELGQVGFVKASQLENAAASQPARARPRLVRTVPTLRPVTAAAASSTPAARIARARGYYLKHGGRKQFASAVTIDGNGNLVMPEAPTLAAQLGPLKHVPGAHFVAQGLEQVGQSFLGIPEALYLTEQHPLRVAKQIPGQVVKDFTDIRHRQGYAALDLFAGLGAAAKLGGHVGAGINAARAGEGAVTAARATLRPAAVAGGRFHPVPLERQLRLPGTEGRVQPAASPSDLMRAVEHAYDRMSERHPNFPLAGARGRIIRRVPFEQERRLDRISAQAVPFQVKESRLNPIQKVAYDLLHAYGHADPVNAVRIVDQEIRTRSERLHAPEGVSFLEKAHQAKQIVALKLARRWVARYAEGELKARRKLHETLAQGTKLERVSEAHRIRMGHLTPETAAERVNLRARLATGGKVVVTPGETKGLQIARRRVQSLEKRHTKAVELRDRAHADLLARELRRAYTETVTQREQPFHTVQTAQARLHELEAQHEQLITKGEERLRSVPMDAAEAERRIAEIDAQLSSHTPHPMLEKNKAELAAVEKMISERKGKLDPHGHEYPASHIRDLEQGAAQLRAWVRQQQTPEELRGLKAERARLVKAKKTGSYLVPHDMAETRFRNTLRGGLEKRGKGVSREDRRPLAKGMPTLSEELRSQAEDNLLAAARKMGDHPSARAYMALREEIHRLRAGLASLDELAFVRRATPEELASRLGRQPGPTFAERVRTPVPAEQQPVALGHRVIVPGRPKGEPLVIGRPGEATAPFQHTAPGRVLHPRYQSRVERFGSALSVARDELSAIEQGYQTRYGHVPEPGSKRGYRVLGGENAGPGAAYISDVPTAAGAGAQRLRRLPSRVTGKRSKQPYQHQSRGILFTQGRAVRSSKTVVRDFTRTARSIANERDIQEAWRFSIPADLESPNFVSPGHVLMNPEGIKVPRAISEALPEEQLAQMTPLEMAGSARKAYQQMLARVFVSPENLPDEFRTAIEEGRIRQIDEKIAAAFEGGIMPGRSHALLSLLDLSNNLTRMGVLYLKGSFIPMNFGGNLLFLAAQQGPWAAVNLVRSAGVLKLVQLENLRWIDHEVGSGAAVSILNEGIGPLGRSARAIAHASNIGADLLPRRAAWLFAAAKRGIRSDAQITELRRQVARGNKAAEATLNQVSEEAERAMVQFRGLSPLERRVISRAIFIYPWIKGASRYFGRLAFDRPLSADVFAHLGEQGAAQTEKQLGRIVSYLEGISPVGAARHQFGTTVVPVRNPAALTPWGTGVQTMQVILGLMSGRAAPAAFRLASYLQPSLQGLLGAAQHVDPATGRAYRSDQGFTQILWQSVQDQFAVINALKIAGRKRQTTPFTGSPGSQHIYVQEGGWKDALYALGFGGARVRLLNVPAQAAKARQEQRASMTREERAFDDMLFYTTRLLEEARATKLPILDKNGKLIPPVDEAVKALAARKLNRLAWAKRNKVQGQMTELDRLRADLELLVKTGKVAPAAAAKWNAEAAKLAATPLGNDKIKTALNRIGAFYFHRQRLSIVEKGLKYRGRDLAPPTP